MYPYLRTYFNIFKARRKPKFEHPFMESEIEMRVWPWDADMFMELNNGRYLTIMDTGRFAFGERVNLIKVLKQNKWGLMVGAVSTRYRRRLRIFEKFTLRTKLIYFSEKWFYFHQEFIGKDGKMKASFLVRTAVTSKDGLVPTQKLIDAMQFSSEMLKEKNQPSEWIEKWEESDAIHKKIMGE